MNKKRGRSFLQSLLVVSLAIMLAASGLLYTRGNEVNAAQPTSEDDFDFEDGTITGYNGYDSEVVIPLTINGETVKAIETAAFVMNDNLQAVTIPATVETIYQNSFMYCENLERVTFEGKVTEIEPEAFSCCAQVITFYCQEQYESYYQDLCDAYDSITDGGAIVDASLPNSGSTDPTDPMDPTDPSKPDPSKPDANEVFKLEETADGIGYAVTGYDVEKGGQDVVIPEEYNEKPIVAIADNAFDRTEANVGFKNWITSVTIPSSVKSIGENAFYGCTRLESITLPEGLEVIGAEAFRYCNSLKKIEIPASVTSIGDLAFKQQGGAHLAEINVAKDNKNYESIDGVLFKKGGKVLICYPTGKVGAPYKMPSSTEEVANDAFKGDANIVDTSTLSGEHKLTEVEFSKNLKKIGDRAFMQTSLESVTLEPGIEMGTYVFDQCKKVKSVTVKEGVTEIPDALFYAFENCESVKLPSTLKKIGYRAFDRLGAKEIELPEGLESIGEEAFENSALISVTIPSTVTSLGDRAFYSCGDLKEVEFKKDAKLETIGAFAFNWCTSLESVKLPEQVKKLDSGCFSYCMALESIKVPEGVAELGDCVFAGSAIKEITLPDSIETIGSATFRDCAYMDTDGTMSGLTSVKMPKNLKELGTCTFEGCAALTNVTFPEDIALTYVPEDTFYNCITIKNIYLPAAIAETRACAFSNCDSNPVIEYANVDLKRNLFDCYPIDPGEYYELREDGYYTTEALADSNYSDDKMQEADKDNKVKTAGQIVGRRDGNVVVYGRSASGAAATCGCGAYGISVKLSPSSNPTFKYKQPASGTTTGDGQSGNNGNNGNSGSTGNNGNGQSAASGDKSNTGANSATTVGKTTPKVNSKAVETGDKTDMNGYIVFMAAAFVCGAAVVAYRRRLMR